MLEVEEVSLTPELVSRLIVGAGLVFYFLLLKEVSVVVSLLVESVCLFFFVFLLLSAERSCETVLQQIHTQ